MVEKGIEFLLNAQNSDGSWGGDKFVSGTIEETALAISALIPTKHDSVYQHGFEWLNKYYQQHGLVSAPIGLYFASLWYDEKMYPLVAYLEAVTRMLEKQL
jgi:squalene-hopene/tetraprenyl-beta-curcumene cyclase